MVVESTVHHGRESMVEQLSLWPLRCIAIRSHIIVNGKAEFVAEPEAEITFKPAPASNF